MVADVFLIFLQYTYEKFGFDWTLQNCPKFRLQGMAICKWSLYFSIRPQTQVATSKETIYKTGLKAASDWFSRSTDVTSTDLVSAKGKTKEVYCCDIVVLIVLILMFLMREGLQCRINILKHCLMKLWNEINQLTFVFPVAETRSIDVSWPRICSFLN